MAVKDPVKVPETKITSLDVLGFGGGLSLLGEHNAQPNQFVQNNNAELTATASLTERKSLQRWLPDTVGTVYHIKSALVGGILTHFVADDSKIKWTIEGSGIWTLCGGDNVITTGNGVKTTFLRVLDVLLILNGKDKTKWVDLKTKNVIASAQVPNPTVAPTGALTVLTTGAYNIYYGYTFSSATGETKLSPILTQSINKPRDNWKTDGTEFLTVNRPAGNPTGAKSWNLYVALASNGGTIQDTDMLMLAGGLDLNTLAFTDNGTLAIDIGRGTPPTDNSTDGVRATHGIESSGRPILFGLKDELGMDTGDILIGGDGEYALDFSASNGGFRAQPSKGTDYYPASVIGFRNGQGIPSLTILFSNTEGISKQATLEQQTINYGNQTFVVWGVTEQNYGAAGVASSYGVVNYNGSLTFPTFDGMMSMDTQPQLQNVLATRRAADDIADFFKSVNTSALSEIVGTGWGNNLYYIVPAYGFPTPNRIAVKDNQNNGSWYTLDIAAQWIGTVSPPDSPAFVYICQGNNIMKLLEYFGTADYKGGAAETFTTGATGSFLGVSDAKNAFKSIVQAVFYVIDFIGEMTIGVNYVNENGRVKTKKKTIKGAKYITSSSGGWSDPQYVYNGVDAPAGWDAVAKIDDVASSLQTLTKRHKLPMDVLASEVQWFYQTPPGYNSYELKSISYEGENLGVEPDL